jgi:plasmid stability protein
MPNINIRGLDDAVHQHLKIEARKKGVSLNTLIVKYLRQEAGLVPPDKKQPIHHELDKLAGTWAKKDVQDFQKTISAFEEIDGLLVGNKPSDFIL